MESVICKIFENKETDPKEFLKWLEIVVENETISLKKELFKNSKN